MNMNDYNVPSLINETIYGTKETSQHAMVLFSLICSIRAKNVLELGVRHGNTTRPLLVGVEYTDGHLTSVDLNPPSFNLQLGCNPPPDHLLNRWTFIQSEAIQYLSNENKKYDLIFVDDWHGSEHVYHELTLIKNLIHDRSLILLHDLMHSFHDPKYNTNFYPGGEFVGMGPYGGVVKFVEENKNFEYATIPVNHGLTILRKII